MINFKAMGQRIKDERKLQELTQEKLAEMLDVTIEHLSHVETGTSRASLMLIEKISEILQIDEETLMFGTAYERNINKELVEKIDSLSPNKKQAVLNIIDLLNED